MIHYANESERDQLIAGLRELAAFLEGEPEVPAPPDAIIFVFPPSDFTDQERRAEIDAIASRICTQPYEIVTGHYVTSRYFGSVEYRAVAIDHETPADPDGA